MIRSAYWSSISGTLNLDADKISAALQDKEGMLWVHIVSEDVNECQPILLDVFGFHPLSVEDALQETHTPRLNDWGEYLYLTLHAVVLDPENAWQITTEELDVFWGANYIVTYQPRPLEAVERIWGVVTQSDHHLRSNNAAYLMYRIADELVADYMPVIESLDQAIDDIEDDVFNNPANELLEQVFTLKRSLLRLRRMIAPQREVINKLARGDYALVGDKDRVFFRDIYDHLVRLYDITESLRDLLGGVLETYLSVINNRMNDVMKVLTIITTLFMPLSFLTGFWG